jgi:hypothetical protein
MSTVQVGPVHRYRDRGWPAIAATINASGNHPELVSALRASLAKVDAAQPGGPDEHIDRLHGELQRAYASTSWRLTAPARALAGAVRSLYTRLAPGQRIEP